MTKAHRFNPTPAMRLYAFEKARNGQTTPDIALADQVGVARETISRWKNITGFLDWLDEQILLYRAPIHSRLEQVALDSLEDFKFWEQLATKYGFRTVAASNDQEKLIINFGGSCRICEKTEGV